MFGLREEEWRGLVLSLNVHRKSRRFSPYQVANLLGQALQRTEINTLAKALGFSDTTTLRRILRLKEVPAELASVVDWGTSHGSVSMSTATELLRLPSAQLGEAIKAAAEHSLTKEEARQVVQVFQRSGQPLEECVRRVLLTRPKIERSELIVGSLLSPIARQKATAMGDETASKKLKVLLAQRYPDVLCQVARLRGDKFSLLLSEPEAAKFRRAIGASSVEAAVTSLFDGLTSA